MSLFTSLAQRAKAASRVLSGTTAEQRTAALLAQAELSEEEIQGILAANQADLRQAEAAGLDAVRLRILSLKREDLDEIGLLMKRIAQRRDLIGEKICENQIEEGLYLSRRMVPLGVVAMLYEARPSVAWDSFALCLRNADALILRPSRYGFRTAEALVQMFRRKLSACGLPEDSVVLAAGGGYQDTYELFRMERFLDIGIVRGGYGAVEAMRREATIPIALCGPGNCHIFIDSSAQYDMVEQIIVNSKVERPLACNATETVLVQQDWAAQHLSRLLSALQDKGLDFVGDSASLAYGVSQLAEEQDWAREFFAPRLAVAIVPDIDTAIAHINRYRSPHTECILTEDSAHVALFFQQVEANAVIHNASSRLVDGGVFGFGGEIGISTGKLPWCGPIATRQLVQEKFFLEGHGNLRK